MKYPLDFGSAELAINNNRSFKGGFYPIGENNLWHGGIHLQDDGAMTPISPILDGKLVAYRISEDYISPEELPESLTEEEFKTFKSNLNAYNSNNGTTIANPYKEEKPKQGSTDTALKYKKDGDVSDDDKWVILQALELRYSNNFVLLEHELKTPKGDDKDNIKFYSLYMHLLPFKYLKYPEEYVAVDDYQNEINEKLRYKSPFHREWIFKLNTARDNTGVIAYQVGNEKKELRILPFGFEIEKAEAVDLSGFSDDSWAKKEKKDKSYCHCYIPGKRGGVDAFIINKKNLLKNEGERNVNYYSAMTNVPVYHRRAHDRKLGVFSQKTRNLQLVGSYGLDYVKMQIKDSDFTSTIEYSGYVKREKLEKITEEKGITYYRVKELVYALHYDKEEVMILNNSEEDYLIIPQATEWPPKKDSGIYTYKTYNPKRTFKEGTIKPSPKKPVLIVDDIVKTTDKKSFLDFIHVEFCLYGNANEVLVKRGDLEWTSGERYRITNGKVDIKPLKTKGLRMYSNNNAKSNVVGVIPKDDESINIYDTGSLLAGEIGFYLTRYNGNTSYLQLKSTKEVLIKSELAKNITTDGEIQIPTKEVTLTTNDVVGYCGDYYSNRDIVHFETFFHPDNIGFLDNKEENSAKIFKLPAGLGGYKKAAKVDINPQFIPFGSVFKVLTPEDEINLPPNNGYAEIEFEKVKVYISTAYIQYNYKTKKTKILKKVEKVYFYLNNVAHLISIDDKSELKYVDHGSSGFLGYEYTMKENKFKGWVKLSEMSLTEREGGLYQLNNFLGTGIKKVGKTWYKINPGAPNLIETVDYKEEVYREVEEKDIKSVIAIDGKEYTGFPIAKEVGWIANDELDKKGVKSENLFDWKNYFEEYKGKVDKLVAEIEAVSANTTLAGREKHKNSLEKEEVWNAVKDEEFSKKLLKHYGKHPTEWDKKGFNDYKKVLKKGFNFNKIAKDKNTNLADKLLFWDNVKSLPKDGEVYYFHPMQFMSHVQRLNILVVHPYPDKKDKWPDNPGFLPINVNGTPMETRTGRDFNANYGSYHHEGIDIGADEGTELKCFIYGTVVLTGDNGKETYGRFVLVQDDLDKKKFYLSAHLSVISVEQGDSVVPGDIIGLIGNTGNSRGAHLHLSVFIEKSEDLLGFTSKSKNGVYRLKLTGKVVDPLNNKIKWRGKT